MNKNKYIIAAIIIIAGFIIYYFYSELKLVKKAIKETNKQMIYIQNEFGKINDEELLNLQKNKSKNYTPTMTITYHSDTVKNGNLSVRYADLSDNQSKNSSNNETGYNVQSGELTDPKNSQKIIDMYDTEKTDTIKFKINNLLKKPINASDNSSEYQNILKGLKNNIEDIDSLSSEKTELNHDAIRSISESIKNNNLNSGTDSISEIPIITKNKKKHRNKKI